LKSYKQLAHYSNLATGCTTGENNLYSNHKSNTDKSSCFSVPHSIETCSAAQSATNPMGAGEYFLGDKAAVA
jgi:hypothetical protein